MWKTWYVNLVHSCLFLWRIQVGRSDCNPHAHRFPCYWTLHSQTQGDPESGGAIKVGKLLKLANIKLEEVAESGAIVQGGFDYTSVLKLFGLLRVFQWVYCGTVFYCSQNVYQTYKLLDLGPQGFLYRNTFISCAVCASYLCVPGKRITMLPKMGLEDAMLRKWKALDSFGAQWDQEIRLHSFHVSGARHCFI